MNISEEIYILYRRLKAVASHSIYFVCSVFPIQNNKIVFSAFEGGGYGCNPKYIAEEIIRRMKISGKKFNLIWLVNDTNKKFPAQIKPVKNNLINRAYHLSTAKIWIDNARKNFGTRKRAGQIYILTWHGLGVKPVGKMRGKSFSRIANIVSQYDSKLIDYFLYRSKYGFENFRKSFYNEPLIKTGTPRCDILINDSKRQREKIRQKLNLNQEVKLLMYAPTFRGGSQSKVRDVFQIDSTLDLKLLHETIEKKFGSEWHILLRLHPQLALRNQKMNVSEKFCTDISFADDMYEYLAGVDIFLTDYSSAAFDAALMKIPIFVYADDLQSYTKDRGGFIRDIYSYPFSVSTNNNQLRGNILDFDEEKYLSAVEKFLNEEEFFEDGQASKRVVDIIEKNIVR